MAKTARFRRDYVFPRSIEKSSLSLFYPGRDRSLPIYPYLLPISGYERLKIFINSFHNRQILKKFSRFNFAWACLVLSLTRCGNFANLQTFVWRFSGVYIEFSLNKSVTVVWFLWRGAVLSCYSFLFFTIRNRATENPTITWQILNKISIPFNIF